MDKKDIFKLSNNWNLHKEDLNEKKYYLFNVSDGDIVKLNEISFEIFKNIDGSKTILNIFDIIYKIYNVDEDILWKDIYSLIKRGLKNKVLKNV